MWIDQTNGLPLWVSMPVVNAHQILIYHGWLLDRIKADSQFLWSSSDDGHKIYAKYGEMYHRVGKLLHPALNPDDLSKEVRHRLFITEGIIDHPFEPGQKLLDMSTLEKMAGRRFTKPKQGKPALPEAVLTTEDPFLDRIVQTVKVFKESASTVLAMNFDGETLDRLLQYAIELENPTEAKKRKQQEMDEAWWKANELRQTQALRAAGVPVPVFPKLSLDE